MATTNDRIEIATQKLEDAGDKAHAFANGDNTTVINGEGGSYPSINKFITDKGVEIDSYTSTKLQEIQDKFDAAQAGEFVSASEAAQQAAEVAANVAMARGLVFPTLAASQGLSLSDVTITNAGTGGTDGTYEVSMLSAGSGGKIRYTVSGGSITEVVVTSRGYGMDGTETITVSNPSDAVLTPVFQDTVVDGDYFWVVSADDSEVLELWLMGAVTATDTGKRTVDSSLIFESTQNINSIVNFNSVLPQQYASLELPPTSRLASTVEIVTRKNRKMIRSTSTAGNVNQIQWIIPRSAFKTGKASFAITVDFVNVGARTRLIISQHTRAGIGVNIQVDEIEIAPNATGISDPTVFKLENIEIASGVEQINFQVWSEASAGGRELFAYNPIITDGEIAVFSLDKPAPEIVFNKSANLFNPKTILRSSTLATTAATAGDVMDHPTRFVSDFIELEAGKTYKVTSELGGALRWATYDLNKNGLSTGLTDTFTGSERNRYARISLPNADLAGRIVVVDNALADTPVGGYSKSVDADINSSQIDFLTKTNLISESDYISGFFIATNSSIVADPEWFFTPNYLPVEGGRLLRTNRTCVALFYDADLNVISRVVIGSDSGGTSPNSASFMRIALQKDRMPYGFNHYIIYDEPAKLPTVGNYRISKDITPTPKLAKSFTIRHSIPSGRYKFDRNIDVSQSLPWGTEGPTYDFLVSKYDELVSLSNGYLTKTAVGLDSSGANTVFKFDARMPLPVTKFAKPLPQILVFPGIHGSERLGPWAMFYLMQQIITNKTDPLLNYLRNNVHFTFVASLNPSGFNAYTRKNFNGVDLNRNFTPFHVVKDPSAVDYGGPAPFSEVETQYADQIIRDNPDAFIVIDLHNFFQADAATDARFYAAQTRGYESPIIDFILSKFIIDETDFYSNEYPSLPATTSGPSAPYRGWVDYVGEAMLNTQVRAIYGREGLIFELNQSSSYLTQTEVIQVGVDHWGNFLLECLRAYGEYYNW